MRRRPRRFVDADCATPPAELARMTRAAADADGVIASRRLPASFTPCARRARPLADVDRVRLGRADACSACPTPTRSAAPR